MQIKNIDRLLMFNVQNNQVMTLEQLQAKYHIEPDGTNFYYGINPANVDVFQATGGAFNPTHKTFFDNLIDSLQNSSADEKTLMLGLEPPGKDVVPTNPYGYVNSHMDLVAQLAKDLAAVQQRATDTGKRLIIAMRFASEMNDTGQAQGGNPMAFKVSFAQVRHTFGESAPDVLLSFSPGLRADLDEALIAQYWPGDEFVDVIGGTWYIGAPSQRAASVLNMQRYFIHRLGARKPFALSEMGGANDAQGNGNDAVLKDMFNQVEALQARNVSFKYLTVFMASLKWGATATLGFLRT
jgi:hypothetical protein